MPRVHVGTPTCILNIKRNRSLINVAGHLTKNPLTKNEGYF